MIYRENPLVETTLRDYVGIEVIKDILGRFLGAVDTCELEQDHDSMEKLREFVLECYNVHYNRRNIDEIK